STPATSRPASWTQGASRMCDPTNSPDIPSATSSLVSACGASRFVLPDGRTVDEHGLAAALASLSARQVKALGLQTSGIYGPPGSTSSISAALQSSLASRLQARLSILGSTLYALTWKAWVTPSGQLLSRLRASVRRTSEIERSGWVTPTVRDWKDTPGMVAQRDGKDRVDQLPRQAYLCGWPTPITNDMLGSGYCYGKKRPDGTRDKFWKLPGAASLTGWPTPTSSLADKGVRSTEDGIREAMRNHGPDLAAVACLTATQPARLTDSGELLTGSVAPGTFPLAHGASSRVGRLRAYGNAIVPQVAAEFIQAFLDVEDAQSVA